MVRCGVFRHDSWYDAFGAVVSASVTQYVGFWVALPARRSRGWRDLSEAPRNAGWTSQSRVSREHPDTAPYLRHRIVHGRLRFAEVAKGLGMSKGEMLRCLLATCATNKAAAHQGHGSAHEHHRRGRQALDVRHPPPKKQ